MSINRGQLELLYIISLGNVKRKTPRPLLARFDEVLQVGLNGFHQNRKNQRKNKLFSRHATSVRDRVKPNALVLKCHTSEGMKLGFTMFLSVQGSLLDLVCIWLPDICPLNAVQPNLREHYISYRQDMSKKTARLQSAPTRKRWYHTVYCPIGT